MTKKARVSVINLGIVHYYVSCQDCEWVYEDYRNRTKGQQEIRRHVRETGHTVLAEKGIATKYFLDMAHE